MVFLYVSNSFFKKNLCITIIDVYYEFPHFYDSVIPIIQCEFPCFGVVSDSFLTMAFVIKSLQNN